MKVVARKGRGTGEVVIELSMARDEAEDIHKHDGQLRQDTEDMLKETLQEHLHTGATSQRVPARGR